MKQYLELLQYIYDNGVDRHNGTDKQDRAYQAGVTETRTRGIFGYQHRFNLQDGFPLLTTKKVHFKAVVHELLWIISGSSNIQYLCKNDVKIRNERPFDVYKKSDAYQNETIQEFAQKIANDDDFAHKRGDLGPVYGTQWRKWPNTDGTTTDQLQKAIDRIKKNPDSRRILVSARNAGMIEKMSIPPSCHSLFQFFVANGKLSCQLYQRSADVFLGVPFNLASYSLLTHMIAQVCDLQVGEFIHTFGDTHIYSDHFEQIKEQLSRTPRSLPTLKLNPTIKNIDDFRYEDISIENYDPHPTIKATVSL